METFLGYELAPQPSSFFFGCVTCKPAKSALGVLLKSYITQESNMPENGLFVLDGGHLLYFRQLFGQNHLPMVVCVGHIFHIC